jgi:hypothetical protein
MAKHTRLIQTSMAPFYVAICIHATFIPLLLFLLPESLSTEARQILTKNAALSREAKRRAHAAQREWEDETPAVEQNDPFDANGTGGSTWSRLSGVGGGAGGAGHSKTRKRLMGNAKRAIKRALGFLEPLAIFLPRETDEYEGKDWSLTFVGMAMFMMSFIMVSLHLA